LGRGIESDKFGSGKPAGSANQNVIVSALRQSQYVTCWGRQQPSRTVKDLTTSSACATGGVELNTRVFRPDGILDIGKTTFKLKNLAGMGGTVRRTLTGLRHRGDLRMALLPLARLRRHECELARLVCPSVRHPPSVTLIFYGQRHHRITVSTKFSPNYLPGPKKPKKKTFASTAGLTESSPSAGTSSVSRRRDLTPNGRSATLTGNSLELEYPKRRGSHFTLINWRKKRAAGVGGNRIQGERDPRRPKGAGAVASIVSHVQVFAVGKK